VSDAALLPASARPAARPERLGLERLRAALPYAALAVVAVAARAYELRDVPRLTDETDEVMLGLAVARGELLPLTNVDAYIGPLWSYLLAIGFLVAGPSSLLPRVLALLAGLATIAATVWLGRELARRLARDDLADLVGLAGAFLLATSSFHAVVSSRIAWSHALTPLAMTLALACLLRWERTRDPGALAGSGLAYGLTVHTHPTALAFAPGLAIWALLRWRATLGSRAGWTALALYLVANLPILVYNLGGGLGSATAAAQVRAAYAGGELISIGGYLRNLGALLASLPLLLAGDIGERRGVMVEVGSPLAFACAMLAAAGLLVAARPRRLLPIWLFASAALVLPVFNGKFEPLFNGRYLAPLLPLAFVLIALGIATLVSAVPALRPRLAPVVAGVVVGLSIGPLLSLGGYIGGALRDGPNNRELYRAAEIVSTAGSAKPVLVDATLSGARLSTGREGTGVLEYLLILDGRLPVRRLPPSELIGAVERGEGDLVVVSPRLLLRLDKDFALEPPPGEEAARRRRRAGFMVARIVGPG
jgi:4-amino-4-deoxy-L-arabinose transferase-like glycosyltransferase